VLDACRADKFGAYGFARPTTPEFDVLAGEDDSVLFGWQISQAPHTRASTASLFSGVYPFQHGVFNEDDLTSELKGGDRYRSRKLAAGYQTLAESFSAGGYRTLAEIANPVIPASDGFGQGFDRYEDPQKGAKQSAPPSDTELVDRGVAFLAEAPSPAFAYVHTSGCHSPTPKETRDPDYFARYGGDLDEGALNGAGVDPGRPRFKFAVRDGKLKLDPTAVAYIETVYEAVLRKVDREIVARTVAALRKAGLYDRTLLAVTADHGEELYDHGGVAHGRTVWNEVLHIPLVVKFPKGARPARLPSRVERVTQTIDLYPGLLRAVGLTPSPGFAGHDLFDPEAKKELAYSQSPGGWALMDFPMKVVIAERQKKAQLFDLERDLAERHDLSAEKSDVLRRLVRIGEGLRKVLPKLGAAEPESELALDPETIEQLRSLGYIQ
jgi:arylsulfatase A-like enzyme